MRLGLSDESGEFVYLHTYYTFGKREKRQYTMSTLICTHFNWDWIVCIAANEISQSDYITPVSTDKNILNTVQPSNITKVSFRQLYSVQRQKCLHPEVKIKPSYALFRLEITEAIELPEKLSSEPDIRGVWADSDAFSFLDAKDSLFRHLKTVGYENAMPPTIMIPWDVTDRNELNRICDDYKQQMKIPINEGTTISKCIYKQTMTVTIKFNLYLFRCNITV